ncbi:complement component c3b, tandem duplicate 2 isoform X2 [Silurus meridionalis]|nr:complement component c3b, tandem duplicate 2 isoform X2 [Silurus meridionalis]
MLNFGAVNSSSIKDKFVRATCGHSGSHIEKVSTSIEGRLSDFERDPKFVVVAPSKLQVGNEENILLEAFGLSEPVVVTLLVYDYPQRSVMLLQGTVTLNVDNNYSVLKTIKIPPRALQQETRVSKYVVLRALFGRFQELEYVSQVSYRSGYIFIQTDKTIYNPGDTVRFRAFASTPEFQAFNSTISVEIQNSDEITIHAQPEVRAADGVYTNTYALSDIAKEGKWKIVAKFDNLKENTYSAPFEVKKYELPGFNVSLVPTKFHLSLEDKEFEVKVYAKYLYGEKVDGVAYVVFGIENDGVKVRVSSMKQVKDLDGGIATLTIDELKKAYPDVSHLDGLSIYVKASVMTTTGSDLVEAEKSGIKIILAPYVLAIKDTSRFYKSGLPFDLTVTVSHHDGSPAPNVPVKISFLSAPVKVHSGTIRVSLNMPCGFSVRTIKVNTVVPELKPEQQAKTEWPVEASMPFSVVEPNHLYITVDKKEAKLGDTVDFHLHLSFTSNQKRTNPQQISYTVLNKGKMIRAGKVNVTEYDVANFSLLLTPEMLPAFRFVAYYILPFPYSLDVMADSLLVNVESRCLGSLKVEPLRGEVKESYSPGDSFNFQLRGDPGAKVSLVAVDNSVFLLKKSYSERFLRRCCSDGMREIPMAYSCRRRALYITEEWSCVMAFLKCCSKYRGEELGIIVTPPPPTIGSVPGGVPSLDVMPLHIPGLYYDPRVAGPLSWPPAGSVVPSFGGAALAGDSGPLVPGGPVGPLGPVGSSGPVGGYGLGARPAAGALVPAFIQEGLSVTTGVAGLHAPTGSDEYYDKLDDIYVRTKFFESWLWTDVQLPEAPGPDGLAVAPVESVLPDSITQWGILGISASASTGFCVAEPFNIRAWKPFFIKLSLPRTAARNEHVEVKAVLHNYMSKDLKVLFILSKMVNMCSVAYTEDHKQEVFVRAKSSVLIPYTVIPLKTGELPLQVTAVSHSFTGRDAVRKTLCVVMEGIQKMDVRSFVLNPADKGDSEGNQVIRMKRATLSFVVPNSVPKTLVNIRGNLLADSIDNSISQDSLAALIQMPGGCVEQNLASITLPLIAVHYLDRSSQWESVGIQRREVAISYIKTGYENQLHYRKSDDSYPPYNNEGTSTWITAFVVKVFSMAYPFITVDKQNICRPLLYLLNHKQLPSGAFEEDNPVYTTSMTGIGLRLLDHGSLDLLFQRAGVYLKERYHRLRRPYSVAIACYALAVSNQGCSKSVLLKSASADRKHWPDAENTFFTLEATGYALLALLKGGHVQEAAAPFQWLNQQRRVGGGFGPTQSTMVVLQALSEYLVKVPPPADMNLKVVLSVPGRSDIHQAFTKHLAHVAYSFSVPTDQDFSVMASGSGQGILEVVTVYNELPDVHKKSSCNGFELNVSISESDEKPPAEVEKVYKLSINVRALEQHQVRMAVLDINLPTGFEPENSDLELLTNAVDRYINNFQVVDNLSDRGSLIIHLFKGKKYVYTRTHKYRKLYSYTAYDWTVIGDCCVVKTDPQTVAARKTAACSGVQHVYKVRALNASMSQYDRYELEILQVIKEGSEVGVKEKDMRVFLSHAGCRAGLNLLTGQDYLIIGPPSDIWQAGSDENGYTYTLGKNTWVEHWPSGACDKCAELDNFSAKLQNDGCQT